MKRALAKAMSPLASVVQASRRARRVPPGLGKQRKRNIVVLGGGTGSFAVLSGLRTHNVNITALVNMADDGGSTGQLRDQLGVLPPGDVRQCLVALSDASGPLRELFSYRFPTGSQWGGHSFGNLFLSATEMMTDDFGSAIAMAGQVLQIKGHVIPVTLGKSRMILTTSDGREIKGQFQAKMHELPSFRGATVCYEAPVWLHEDARTAIMAADMIVIAPGDLYTSIAPALAVNGMAQALQDASAPVLYICNLINKPHQTVGFGVSDYADEIERLMGGRKLDYVLYNTDKPSAYRLKAYALDGEYPVRIDAKRLIARHYQAIGGEFLSRAKTARNANDSFIFRSLIRHDGKRLAQAIVQLTKQARRSQT